METTIREVDDDIIFATPRRIFRFRDDDSFFVQSGTGFAAAPDKRFLVMMAAAEEPAEITTLTLVVGWTSDLTSR